MQFSFDLISDINKVNPKAWDCQPTSMYCVVAGNVHHDRIQLKHNLEKLAKKGQFPEINEISGKTHLPTDTKRVLSAQNASPDVDKKIQKMGPAQKSKFQSSKNPKFGEPAQKTKIEVKAEYWIWDFGYFAKFRFEEFGIFVFLVFWEIPK